MCNKYSLNSTIFLLASLLLTACGPGGGNSGDVFPRETQPTAAVTGPNSFLLFPNPQKQDDGSLQTNTTAYATAYYEAIDPNNDKDTLAKWKTANGFGSGTGTEVTAVFGDVKDLGYGRRMTARQNTDGSLAFVVENYLVGAVASYSYSDFNVEAAVVSDKRWHVGTNGIEFSSAACISGVDLPASSVAATGYCSTTTKFAKFYTFDPTTGARLLEAQLDGRGKKAMPGICINCHGGRGDPLTPAAGSSNGKQLFNLVHNTVSQKRGDVMANLQPLKVDSFGYSSRTGYSRAEQEANLKSINKMVLSSYPIAAATAFPEDALRRTPIAYGEWPGTAAAIIKNAYGGNGLPNTTFADSYLPTGWSGVGQTALYQNVVASSCRTCHILRGGSSTNDEINFDTYCTQTVPGTCDAGVNFYGYADRIKAHVIDRGNMPLAKIVFERLWGTGEADTLATFLGTAQSQPVRDSGGVVLKPGRPVAVPGPDRTTTTPATLSAAGSLYATSYNWSKVSGTATLTNPTSVTATLAGANGTNVLRLVVSDGTTQSASVDVTVILDSTLSPAPSAIRFSDIKAVLQSNSAGCSGCHTSGGGPPVYYTNYDRNGDTLTDATDDRWFYTELRGRINFTDIAASPLLRKPSGHHHGGGLVFNTTSTTACAVAPTYPDCSPFATLGAYNAAKYNMFVNWILNGAPY
jgi:mono/diheme cytochrome c family protein